MNKPLKFSSAKTKLLWCSDPHLQHRPDWGNTPPLWKSRGFKSGDEHDAWFDTEWIKHVDLDTIVFSLGDHTFSDPKGERFRRFSNLPGKILGLTGNHFSGLKTLYREAMKTRGFGEQEMLYPFTLGNFTLMGESIHAYIDSTSVFMTHYANYLWPEIGNGGYHVFGHSHGRAETLNPEDKTFGKGLDIGVDNAIKVTGSPFFDWDSIKRIMASKPVVKRDHH